MICLSVVRDDVQSYTYDQDGNTVTNTYNTDKGLLTSTTNQKGETTSYTYNTNNGEISRVT